MEKNIAAYQVRFRWPVKQDGETSVMVHVPMGGDVPIINPAFARQHDLSDRELDACQEQVIREIMVIK